MTSLARVLALIAEQPLPYVEIAKRARISRPYAATCVRDLRAHGWAAVHHVETGMVFRRGQRMGRREWITATEAGRVALRDDPDLRCLQPAADVDARGWPVPRDRGRTAEIYAGRRYDGHVG